MGAAGLVLAIALSMGAFALAGRAVGEPASAVQISTPAPVKHSPGEHVSPTTTRPTQSPADDHSSSPSALTGSGGSPQPADDQGGGGHGADD